MMGTRVLVGSFLHQRIILATRLLHTLRRSPHELSARIEKFPPLSILPSCCTHFSNIRAASSNTPFQGSSSMASGTGGNSKMSQEESVYNPKFNLKLYVALKLKSVNEGLEEVVPLQHPHMLTESVRYSLLAGGKRMCPIMCIAACELVGGDESTAMPVACALDPHNVYHSRRPAMYGQWRSVPTNHKVFGEQIAMLAGDALLTAAYEHIARTTKGVRAEQILRVIALIGKSLGPEGAVAGQIVDIASEGDPNVTRETLEYIHIHKTAMLCESPAASGAVLGGASEDEVEKLSKYALYVGHMYQVMDDILDVTKSSEELGKTAGKDVPAGKATYPKLLGLEKSKELAQELNRKAKKELQGFDQQKALPLLHLAVLVAQRQR